MPVGGNNQESGGVSSGKNKFFSWKFASAQFGTDACANKEKIGAKVDANVRLLDMDVGPAHVRYGLGLDTGASLSKESVEAKFLGTGFKLGKQLEVAFMGSGVTLDLAKFADMVQGK